MRKQDKVFHGKVSLNIGPVYGDHVKSRVRKCECGRRIRQQDANECSRCAE